MEKKLRAFLLNILGLENYLSLVSDIYIRLIKIGMMKEKYPELFFLKKMVKSGFVCLDIGANVGYYSVFLSEFAGDNGKVFSVEPVSLFATVFKRNIKKFALNNITLHQTALGGENKIIQMGTPMIDGVFRHGLTKIVSENDQTNLHTYDVQMCVPDELFSSLERFDFMKCDVEGYEVFIMPHFVKTLSKFKPQIQMEISSEENRKQIFDILFPLGYSAFKLQNHSLQKMNLDEAIKYNAGDFYFSVEK